MIGAAVTSRLRIPAGGGLDVVVATLLPYSTSRVGSFACGPISAD